MLCLVVIKWFVVVRYGTRVQRRGCVCGRWNFDKSVCGAGGWLKSDGGVGGLVCTLGYGVWNSSLFLYSVLVSYRPPTLLSPYRFLPNFTIPLVLVLMRTMNHPPITIARSRSNSNGTEIVNAEGNTKGRGAQII